VLSPSQIEDRDEWRSAIGPSTKRPTLNDIQCEHKVWNKIHSSIM
jgi:hypothetical protein